MIEKKRNRAFILFILSGVLEFMMLLCYSADIASFVYKLRSMTAVVGIILYLASNVVADKCLTDCEHRQLWEINIVLLVGAAVILFDLFSK